MIASHVPDSGRLLTSPLHGVPLSGTAFIPDRIVYGRPDPDDFTLRRHIKQRVAWSGHLNGCRLASSLLFDFIAV